MASGGYIPTRFSRVRSIFNGVVLVAGLVLLAAAFTASSRTSPGMADLLEAHRLVESRQFDAATPLLKRYMLARPDEPIAHYLLGKCYLHAPNAALSIALGEFRTADNLLSRQPEDAPLAGFSSRDAFAVRLNMDLALVHMRALYHALEHPEAPVIAKLARDGLSYVERGLALDPHSVTLLEMRQTLRDVIVGEPSKPSQMV